MRIRKADEESTPSARFLCGLICLLTITRLLYWQKILDKHDCVLIHKDKEYLKKYLAVLQTYIGDELHLSLNEKTEIFPIKNGVDYLGWHFYMTDTGKVIRKVKQSTKYKYKRKIRCFLDAYSNDEIELDEIKQVRPSYCSQLSFGHTYKLQKKHKEEEIE